ncbi:MULTISPECIES: 16S rRNA (guanine(527)-N(7))-methyltransferase RsmG [Paracoccus]|uniref:16S rRNA (guanine(527)-N(7))-methyltransferase RsmG n=1 Tax=Paracoccus TaxID=265 RepID=UPI000225F56A|nr:MULTISPECIES: 16S rRNA (guanine(527)-N(7))-methyltransferase RsmG [Paracoccus]
MLSVSRETAGQLAGYAALLRKWNPAINLIAPSTVDQIESRHIADCTHLAEVSVGAQGKWADLGSGGGLPAVVLAIARPDLNVTMVESDQRKASFLRTAIRELSLKNAQVISQRIEVLDRLEAAHVSARALAPLPRLMSYVERHLETDGTAWLMKGRNWQAEVSEARKDWSFDLKAHPSATDPDAAILEITGIRHA